MDRIFLSLYDYFHSHKRAFYFVLTAFVAVISVGAWHVELEEDVSRFFPRDEKIAKLNQVFQNSRFMEKMVVMISLKDSTAAAQPDSLVAYADDLSGKIQEQLAPFVRKLSARVDDAVALKMFETFSEHLPVFLEERDYAEIDSLITPKRLKITLENDYHQLISPAGIVMKRMIAKDPVGISNLVMRKMMSLQYDENYELYENYIVTKDHRHLLFFFVPAYSPNDTGHNARMLELLDGLIAQSDRYHPSAQALYFGAAAVAAGNAKQLRSDTTLTVSLMIVLLIVFLFGFLRKKRAPVLILIPVLFGGLFSLACITLVKGSVSVIAIGAGSVILGIAVNYSLHFLAHLRHTGNVREVLKDLVHPMTIGSTTTVLAFFCLQFVNAGVLRDLGLFAGFSLIGAALCSLIFLPHFVNDNFFGQSHSYSWVDKLASVRLESKRVLVISILALTPVLFYFAGHVSFNNDMNSLNFMNGELKRAQHELDKINTFSLSSAYIVSEGRTVEEALRYNEQVKSHLDELKRERVVEKISTVSTFIVSDSLQQKRIQRWNAFWTVDKKSTLLQQLQREGEQLKFSPLIIHNFDSLLNKRYTPVTPAGLHLIRTAFFDDYVTEKRDATSIVTLVKVNPGKKTALYKDFESVEHVQVLDKQMLTNMFVTFVHADFNIIVTFTSIIVFVALLVAYGRIELTMMTFIPMLITWIWILGIMAIVGIEFNIVNVMISTFIFGLGDDYSIFIMDGLQQEYKTGKESLPSIKTSIFLSAITTISGLGVLIFAKHPALKSIAGISIIGIVCVFIMSQTLEPFFFRLMISGPASRRRVPRTAWRTIKSFVPYTYFTITSFIAAGLGFLMLRVWPFNRERMKLAFHFIISKTTSWIFPISMTSTKKVIYDHVDQFKTPSVIIANHQSILDILTTVGLTPKILLVTNEWVWNSPVFGFVVRLAEYYPVTENADENVSRMQDRIRQGYSILIFPEGTRTEDGRLKRFHKGAFFIAEKLGVGVTPLLIHGSGDLIPKGEFYVDRGEMTLKFLPTILPNDERYGTTYSERAKSVSRYFKEEYRKFSEALDTPAYFRHKLISNYLYKGPVLEWYMRIKTALEKNYETFHNLIPRQATILDLGCGYGFMCYMLHFLSGERYITGVDYDGEKITVANNCYSKTEKTIFECSDITQYTIGKQYDVIILADVLHYLDPVNQILILQRVFNALTPTGCVIIREGNKDMTKKHRGTELSEFFSVKLLGFNKSINALNFISGDMIIEEAAKRDLAVEVLDETKFTSNLIFIVKRKPVAA